MELEGEAGALKGEDAPMHGAFQMGWMSAPGLRIAGGTDEILQQHHRRARAGPARRHPRRQGRSLQQDADRQIGHGSRHGSRSARALHDPMRRPCRHARFLSRRARAGGRLPSQSRLCRALALLRRRARRASSGARRGLAGKSRRRTARRYRRLRSHRLSRPRCRRDDRPAQARTVSPSARTGSTRSICISCSCAIRTASWWK